MDAAIFLGRAIAERRGAEQWKAYAQHLEHRLRSVEANLVGNKARQQAALRELAKIDPKNYLMVQQNRQRIYDAEYDAVLAGR